MKIINDSYDIIEQFNKACHALADQFIDFAKKLDVPDFMVVRLPNVTIPNIDDWWVIAKDDEADTFLTGYIESLQSAKNTNPSLYEAHMSQIRDQFFKSYPNLKDHFLALTESFSEPHMADIKYLPHATEYAYPVFVRLDGFKKLQSLCQQMQNVSLNVILQPKDEALAVTQPGAYCFYLVFKTTDGEPFLDKIQKLPQPNPRRMN